MKNRLIAALLALTMTASLAACENAVTEQVSVDGDDILTSSELTTEQTYPSPVVTTGQTQTFDKDGNVVELEPGNTGYGQDGNYDSTSFAFVDNGDGTISDLNTVLMWIALREAQKMTWSEAVDYVEELEFAGYDDWRLPTPEELFSLSDFSEGWPYLDTEYFQFNEDTSSSHGNIGGGPQGGDSQSGGTDSGERSPGNTVPPGEDNGSEVDAPKDPPTGGSSDGGFGPNDKETGQFWTCALSQVEGDARLQGIAFGVNHMTGHIKAYPAESKGMGKYVRAVRGDVYGAEDYTDNGDGTVTDNASGLMWTSADLGVCVDWETALELAENSEFAGYSDWRLPDVKELQSIVDYSGTYPAINQDYFTCTESEENPNYYYWTSTSAYFNKMDPTYDSAWYVAFGYTSHGAGAVRFSPKYEESSAVREGEDNILNSVRLVRNADGETTNEKNNTAGDSQTTVSSGLSYPIVDTNQGLCYDDSGRIDSPSDGEAFYGQDAQYTGNVPSYTDNGDGTVTDNVTGLTWAQSLSESSMSWKDAVEYCENLTLGGYDDWRLPSLKELWSIRDYSMGWPWVDTEYFYLVGDGTELNQHHSWSSTLYLVESEYQNEQVVGDPAFIVNDWTGHIKAMSGSRFVRAVRGDEYGINDFVDNGDGTVTDNATGLMWSQMDSGEGMSWEEALAYAESSELAGYDDWRLPNIKELQSIADYSGVFPVLNPSVFTLTELTNIKGQTDYPFYWSSTSNAVVSSDGDVSKGTANAWVLAAGYNTDQDGYDLHGAGSVVFCPKNSDTDLKDNVNGPGQESLEIHRTNYVMLVRGGDVTETPEGDPSTIKENRVVLFKDGIVNLPGGRGQRGGIPSVASHSFL